MTAHYEEIIEFWKEGHFFDAIRYFSRWMPKGLLSEEEGESFKKELVKFWEFIEAECEENPEFLFDLYQTLKNARNWDDKVLSRKLRISNKAIEDINLNPA
jgi:hypothetical protein